MTTPIKIKRSGTASSTPSSLDHGELAINYADATLFWKDSSNVIQSFVLQSYSPTASPTFSGVITVSATSGSAGSYLPSVTFSGDPNTGFGQVSGQSDSASVFTAGHERVRVDSFGRLTIFATSASTPCVFLNAASNGQSLDIRGRSSDGTGIFQFSTSGGTLVSRIVNSTTDMSIRAAADGRISLAKSDGTNVLQSKSTGAVRFVPLSADPASGEAGDVYYNSASNELRYHNGSAFAGAAPAASPTFTGNATFSASSGVPVTITNTGTGNSFVVEDAASDTTPFVISNAGRVGVNASVPFTSLDVAFESDSLPGSGFCGLRVQRPGSTTTAFGSGIAMTALDNKGGIIAADGAQNIRFFAYDGSAISEKMRLTSAAWLGIGRTSPASALDVNGVITVSATSGSAGSYAPSVTFSGDSNTGFGQVSGQSDTASIFTAGHERVRVDSSGRVGIGVTPSYAIDVAHNDSYQMRLKRAVSGQAGLRLEDSAGNFHQIASASNIFVISSGASERLRIDASGRLGVGTTGPSALLDINADTIRLRTAKTPASASDTGNAGDICWDASYLYICTATNTWRRIAHSTW